MSTGISALCRTCPRLASRHARQVAARSIASHPSPRTTTRPNCIALPRSYATVTTDTKSVSKAPANKLPQISDKAEKHERNKTIRRSFQNPSQERVAKELKGAFVSSWRQYPSEDMTALSEKECKKEARKLAGAHAIWEKSLHSKHFLVEQLDWHHIHELLKGITPRSINDDNRVSAMRVVLSDSLIESDSLGKGVNFISSVTGILEKLRVSPDAKSSDGAEKVSFILRGGRRALSHAADELSKIHEGVEVFELGDVATTDYHTQRLWPTKDVLSEEDLKAYNRSTRDRLWLHPEPEPHWITKRFSDIPKPEKGNAQAFESYITELVCSRIRSDHVLPLYYEGHKDGYGKNIDIETDRARMIMEAFEDPENQSSITSTSLKRALSHLARIEGYRGKAKRLFRLAEDLGLPMDTENYNIMLEGIANSNDYRDFHKWITKMKTCEFEPNARTWLLFLRLVKKDDIRQQVVSSMFERNLLTHESVRRSVAAISAPMDAHQAFKSGADLKQFIREHNSRFGYLWYSREALFGILREYFRFFRNTPISAVDWSFLVEQKFECGERLDTQSMNDLVELCVENKDWVGAIWGVNFMQNHRIVFDDKTIKLLMGLACDTGNYFAFTATLFHGVHHRAINWSAKQFLKFVLLNQEEKNPWRDFRIPLFTASMAEGMRTRNAFSKDHVSDQISEVYREAVVKQQLVPAEPLAMSLMSALTLHYKAAELQGTKTAELPALEIPMKLRGDSDDAVKETFKFDSTVVLHQERAPLPKPEERAEPRPDDADKSAGENQEVTPEEESGLADIAQAAEEDSKERQQSLTKAPRPKKQPFSSFQPPNSPFHSALNTSIPKAPNPRPKPTHEPRPLSSQEAKMLRAIRANSAPRPGNEAARLARARALDAKKQGIRNTKLQPWLYDDFHKKDLEAQNEDTAEWLFHRYNEIKSKDFRNMNYSSRAKLLMRAREEIEQREGKPWWVGREEEVEAEEAGEAGQEYVPQDYDMKEWGFNEEAGLEGEGEGEAQGEDESKGETGEYEEKKP